MALRYYPTSERIAIRCFVLCWYSAVLVVFQENLKMFEALLPSHPKRIPDKAKLVQFLATLLG